MTATSPRHSRRPARNVRRGFTLLEILLVIAIIGVLAGAVAFTMGGSSDRAKEDLTRSAVNSTIPGAIERYKLHVNQLPSSLNDLITNPGAQGWEGPYLKSDQIKDGWGNPLVYQPAGNTYMLYSWGRNGAEGGGDDIAKTE